MKRHPLVCVVAVIGLLGLACAKPAAPQALETASFSYTPTPVSGGQGISLALVSAKNSDRLAATFAAPGQLDADLNRSARDAISRSLVAYFTGAGFTVSGPFKSVDEMTFPEKKQADLILTVEFDLVAHSPSVQKFAGLRDSGIQISNDKYAAEGDCTLGGSVSFVMWEPLSMQRMWAKSADLDGQTQDCTIKLPGVQGAEYNAMMTNNFVRLYEAGFASTMKTAERYFNPEEVALVKTQSAELREKKVY